MLKIKDKYDYRKELCDALRSGRHKQTFCEIGTPADPNSTVCFIGVAMRTYPEVLEARGNGHRPLLAAKLGISVEQLCNIVVNNDRGRTFSELAEILEDLP